MPPAVMWLPVTGGRVHKAGQGKHLVAIAF